jgi:hypothetical protein
MKTGQGKLIGQERRATMAKLMGLTMPSLNINIMLMGLGDAFPKLFVSEILTSLNEPTHNR